MIRLPLVAVCLALLSLSTGCSKEKKVTGSERFATEHAAELRTFRERLTAVAAAAESAPPLTADGFSEAVELDTRQARSGKPEGGNTRTWQLDLLQNVDARPTVRLGAAPHDLRKLDEWLADNSRLPGNIGEMERLLALKYILVLRVQRAQAAENKDKSSFRAGGVVADALLFRLADAAPLGGVRFGSRSSSQIEVRGAAATSTGLDRKISLAADLTVQAHRALGRKLKAALPSITLDPAYQAPPGASQK